MENAKEHEVTQKPDKFSQDFGMELCTVTLIQLIYQWIGHLLISHFKSYDIHDPYVKMTVYTKQR